MNENNLPVHPATGLRALGVLPSGRIVWPVLGGDGTDDGETSQTDEPADDGHTGDVEHNDTQGETADVDGDGDPEGADQLGDPGKKALAAQKQKWKTERDRRRELEKQLAEATKPKSDSDEPTPDQIRADAEQAATARANARIIRAELRAAAAGKLADPADALAFLDPAEFEVDESGEVDADEVSEAITDLLTRKPHLAAGEKRRFQGGGDGGAGRDSKPRSLDQQIAEAEAKGDIGASLRLKQAKLAEARKTNK